MFSSYADLVAGVCKGRLAGGGFARANGCSIVQVTVGKEHLCRQPEWLQYLLLDVKRNLHSPIPRYKCLGECQYATLACMSCVAELPVK